MSDTQELLKHNLQTQERAIQNDYEHKRQLGSILLQFSAAALPKNIQPTGKNIKNIEKELAVLQEISGKEAAASKSATAAQEKLKQLQKQKKAMLPELGRFLFEHLAAKENSPYSVLPKAAALKQKTERLEAAESKRNLFFKLAQPFLLKARKLQLASLYGQLGEQYWQDPMPLPVHDAIYQQYLDINEKIVETQKESGALEKTLLEIKKNLASLGAGNASGAQTLANALAKQLEEGIALLGEAFAREPIDKNHPIWQNDNRLQPLVSEIKRGKTELSNLKASEEKLKDQLEQEKITNDAINLENKIAALKAESKRINEKIKQHETELKQKRPRNKSSSSEPSIKIT